MHFVALILTVGQLIYRKREKLLCGEYKLEPLSVKKSEEKQRKAKDATGKHA